MPDFGLTTTGFVPQPVNSIRDEINASIQVRWSPSIDLSDRAPLGHFVGIVAERLGALWELAELVNAQQDPDAATGTGLRALCALTGTFAPDPFPSTVVLTLTGTAATSVASGSRAATSDEISVFETTETVVLAALTAWVNTTAYVVGDRRSNASRSYICITAGTSAGSGGPTTTSADITDGTVHWRYMGEGTAAADAAAACVEDGPTVAVSGDITEIVTAVGGWSSVINLLDADLGRDAMTDEQLRLLREAELATPGTGTAEAIRAALLAVEGVTSVTVFVNDTDATNSDGMPPHSVEALVRGGDNQDILDVLFRNVAAGIVTVSSGSGAVDGTVTDSEGVSHDVHFSRPDEVEIYIDVTLLYDASLYPADGDDQVKLAIATRGNLLTGGRNATASAASAWAFAVPGVLDVTDIDIDDASSPPDATTVQISTRQLAVFDTSRITVSSSATTP